MYIIDTTLLDEINLLTEKCNQWIITARQTLEYIRESPAKEATELKIFVGIVNESNDDFTKSIVRLTEIAGMGIADDLLYKEVRNNLLNSTNTRQESMYIEGVVFPIGSRIEQALTGIRELREMASFNGEDKLILINEIDTLLQEITVNSKKQAELELQISIKIGWLYICQFYTNITILEDILKKLSYIDGTSGYKFSQGSIKEKIDKSKISQASLALFFFYAQEKKHLPPFQAGRMQEEYRKAVEPYGLSWKAFQMFYNRFSKSRGERQTPGNIMALKDVIPLLQGYPEALEMARDELKMAETRNPLT